VFPCKPGSKAPDCAHSFQDATTSPARIRAWWQARPDRNVAIATGHPGPDVLDVDVRGDRSGFAAFNRCQAAGLLAGASALVCTPSGGLHVYYRGTAQRGGSLPRHLLDFKAHGGYVLAPPSVVNGRPYMLAEHRPASGELLDWQAIRQLLAPPRAAPRLPRDGDVTRLAAWVAAQPEGNRNRALYWAALRTTDTGPLITAAVAAGLTEHEAEHTVKSAAGRTAP
jgi:hypothetical protein